MNIHHLELFYYVAAHGGIMRAVRAMPYGIQQPAVSSQIIALEQDLGTRLFERTPFRLTPAGEELFAFIAPFFGQVEEVGARLRRSAAPLLRLGGSELALRDHIPAIIGRVQQGGRKLRLGLRSGYQQQLEEWLETKQIDVAISSVDERPPARFRCERLVRLPLVLLAPAKSRYRSAPELWSGGSGNEPLITMPAGESLSRIFARHMKALRVDWPAAIEASSFDLITQYVANGYGVGVSAAVPGAPKPAGVRVLPLEGAGALDVVALWRGEPTPLVSAFLEAARAYVKQNWPGQPAGGAAR